MDDRQLEALLKDNMQRAVDAHIGVLDGLEERVCKRLTPHRAARPASPWLPRVRLSLAFAGTAMAALVLGLFIGGTFGSPFGGSNYQGLTFIVAMPEAHEVAVVGDFNGWKPTGLRQGGNGIWSLAVDLPPGRYEYAFIVDGVAWKPDPRADEYVKSYGFTNSVKYVSAEGESS